MMKENDVILSVLKLSRAMRRCPPPPAEHHPFPPAAGRLLACVADNSHVSSRDLCELLDLRPSSLSEMLSRAESEGWITRTVDDEDRRVQRIDLTPKGAELVSRMQAAREADLEKKTACFTAEEKAQFCALCNKLSEHLESLASDVPEGLFPPFGHGRPGGCHGRNGRPPREDCPHRNGRPPQESWPQPEEPEEEHHRPFPPEGRLRC